MALDTFDIIANKLLLHCPQAGIERARTWITNVYRDVAEKRQWSWRVRQFALSLPALYTTGTVTLTPNSITVTGVGTAFDSSFVGRSISQLNVTQVIASYISPTQLELELAWSGPAVTAQPVRIAQSLLLPPQDFEQWLSVYDPVNNYPLGLIAHNAEINEVDPQRASSGLPSQLSFKDYAPAFSGLVVSPLQVVGSGPAPSAGGSYTGPADGIYSITITTGGASGTAVFQWKKDFGSFTTGVVTATTPILLSQSVTVAFPVGVYVLGDTFIIRVYSSAGPGLPRYELWPYPTATTTLTGFYVARVPDLTDTGAILPRYIRGDVLLHGGLAQCARWPGADNDHKNPYYQQGLSEYHTSQYLSLLGDLMLTDNGVAEYEVYFQKRQMTYPGGAWLQSHEPDLIGYI